MGKKKVKNRYVVLAGLFVNSFCLGGAYAWSVFAMPLAEARSWDYGMVTLAYSLYLLINAFFGIPGGKLINSVGPRKLMFASCVLFGGGWLMTGFASNTILLYLFFSVCCGIGCGLRYNPCVTTATLWFPDKKGFASGLVLGAMGLAPLVLAPVANMLLVKFNVLAAFKILGLLFFIISILASLFVDAPPEGYVPEGMTDTSGTAAGNDGATSEPDGVVAANVKVDGNYTWQEMMKTRKFYILWIVFLGSCVAGLMLIGHASAIGQELAGITAGQAAMLVGILALANFGGRMIMGTLSDAIGRYPTLMICLAGSTMDMLLMTHSHNFAIYLISIVLVGITFGGVLATYPSIISDSFGSKNMGINYGIVFTAYGIAAVVGPMTATSLKGSTGGYTSALIFAGVCSGLALVLIFVLAFFGYAKEKNI